MPAPNILPASPRDLADLVRAGYLMLRQPVMQAAFEVHHAVDRPGYIGDYFDGATDRQFRNEIPNFGEIFASSANGLGVVITTRAETDAGHDRWQSGDKAVIWDQERRIFRGRAHQNPVRFYDSTWRYEALICIEPRAQRFSHWHGQAIRKTVHKVAELALEDNTPILFIQAPAQLPLNYTSQMVGLTRISEDMSASIAIAVRFAIALGFPNADRTLRLSERLAAYCSTHGFGLWLADTQPDGRLGGWDHVVPWAGDHMGSPPPVANEDATTISYALPVSLAGPARASTTHAVMSLLNRYTDIGIAGCSVRFLEDLAFIHLQLSCAGLSGAALRDRSRTLNPQTLWSQPAPEALYRVLSALLPDRPYDHRRYGALASQAGDYQCLVGQAHALLADDRNDRVSIWFSWQTRGMERNPVVPLIDFLQALVDIRLAKGDEDHGRWAWRPDAPNIENLLCRKMGSSVRHGVGKLSIERRAAFAHYRSETPESRLVNLCLRIEDAWLKRIDQGGNEGVQELSVSSREQWIGDWAIPL